MPRAPDLGWQERLQAARLALRTAGLAAAAVSVSPPGQPEAAVALAALEDAAAALRARLSELASLAGSTSGAEDRAALQAVLTDAEQLVKTRDRLRQRLLTAGREAAAAAPAVNTALLLRKPQPAAEAAAGLENPPQPAAAPAPEGTASHIAQRLAQMAEEREGLQEQRRKGWWRG